MAKLTPRYSRQEYERLKALICPVERNHEFGYGPWKGEGFRHYLDPKIICIEHFMPKNKPILPGAILGLRRKPAGVRRG
jgi:hypothetical protein